MYCNFVSLLLISTLRLLDSTIRMSDTWFLIFSGHYVPAVCTDPGINWDVDCSFVDS